jgi:peptidoglycan/LPS O-acetylase OafA/YrhL
MTANQQAPCSSATQPAGGSSPRRGDLDALRSVAMLLGVFLHASLAYFPYPWPVQDAEQVPFLPLAYAVIHGFRMPLFFLLSGFFTMLLLRRRGLRALLTQRALRILLPLVLAAATILPLTSVVIRVAIDRGSAAMVARNPLTAGILAGDLGLLRASLRERPDLTATDPVSGLTPLALAAQAGDPKIVAALLEAGAAVEGRDQQGGTPLHSAAFMGSDAVADLLLAHGADPAATNAAGQNPLESITFPASIAVAMRKFLGLSPTTADAINRGRDAVRQRLAGLSPENRPAPLLDSISGRYQSLLASSRFTLSIAGGSLQLFETAILDHLWFLWYLTWLVGVFAVGELLGLSPRGRHRWWLLPATCLPASLMWSPFGPDTQLGLLPAPHLLVYYGCFFWFGAASYAAEGTATQMGRHWRVVLPLSIVVLFPAAIATIGNRPAAVVLQTAFAWGMSLSLIGLFHALLHRERPWVRWLSDASYWVYLLHLPLVIATQTALVGSSLPGSLKLLIVLTLAVAITLITYRWCVRYTAIGLLLNGPRTAQRQLP